MINKKRLIKLLQELIHIDSQNPPGDEAKIADFTREYLRAIGLKVKIYQFKKGRPNVVAHLSGAKFSHSLLITPHLDTVPAGRNWKYDPFAGVIERGRIYGLGATDCKVNLASALEAIRSIKEDGRVLDYDLIFAATADEECGSDLGLIPLLKKGILKPSAAVVLDADDFEIIVAQKGLMHIKVKIEGSRAHGAYPDRGVNAIDIALNAIKEIKHSVWPYASNKYLKPPTINVGTIRGGDKVNVVADWCEFELDFRFLPGTSAGEILKKTKNIIAKSAKKSKIEIEGIQQPYEISPDHSLVRSLVSAMRKNRLRPRVSGSEGATVITFFQHKGIPAVATGFGCDGCAHSTNEFVTIGNLWKGANVLEDFLRHYHWKK
ncbi:MAG: M20 family metallopeptidase [Candidatus Omnitrophota bacterium]|nr:M20 family metallopeptidase [Candidatus Omnitrophota bacterium]